MGINTMKSAAGTQRLAEIAFNRGTVYELLSHCYGEPAEEFLHFLSDGEFFKTITNALRFHPHFREGIIKTLHILIDEVRSIEFDDLSKEYLKIVSPEKNLLYEGNYHHPFNSYEEMADISGFYRAFGFDFIGERPDHLCLELEFMRILSLKESIALNEGNQDNLKVTINAEKDFISSHLGRWIDGLVKMTEGINFYGTLTRFLKEWVEMECDHFSVRCERIFYLDRMNEDINELCLKEEDRDERF